jgi:tetraacyldisaccharide 4'-kinase
VVPLEWIDCESKSAQPAAVKLGRVAAFCGLGNPRAFWQTLDDLEVEVAFRWTFGDHHHYKPAELERLAKQATQSGADTLVTTEKDMINFCEHVTAIVAPHKMLWLRIGIEIEQEEEFLQQIL